MNNLNPGIILGIQQPNIPNALAQGAQAAGTINAVRENNALAPLRRQSAELGVEQQRMGLKMTEAQIKSIADNARLAARKEARAENADALQAELRQQQSIVAQALANPDAADQIFGSNPLTQEYVGQSPEAVAAALIGAEKGLSEAGDFLRKQQGQADGPSVQSSEILHDGSVVAVLKDGTTQVSDPAGNVLEGEARAAAIQQAREQRAQSERSVYSARREGTLGADIEMGGAAEATKALGKEQATFVTSAFEQADKTATSINNIQTAINALDAGARSGAIDKYLPDITEASASLRNSMDRMGLDVIGSVTFGALSEGEMNLAMETAVPRNLDEPELRSWLSKKLDAQRKMRVALMEQAQFLSNPQNSLNEWAEKVGQKTAREMDPTQGGAAPDYSAMSSIDDLLANQPTTEAQAVEWNRRYDALQGAQQ